MMTEAGLSKLAAMRYQTFYIYTLLNDIEKQNRKIFPEEYKSLNEASEVFDTILFGSGRFEERYLHNRSMKLSDFYVFSTFALDILEDDIKNTDELESEFDKYKNVIRYLKNKQKIPDDSNQRKVLGRMKNFLQNYNRTLSRGLNYSTLE